MQIKAAMFSTLSGIAGLTLVASSGGCLFSCPDDETFSIDEAITAEDVAMMLNGSGDTGDTGGSGTGTGDAPTYDSVADIPCMSFCLDKLDIYAPSIIDCTLDVAGYEASTMPTEVVGSVQCSGTAPVDCIGGRRPLGHIEAQLDGGDALGRMFAGAAHLEAASVVAFEQLAGQLAGWGAPPALIQRCRAAADDERRHADTMTRFASQRGATVPPVQQVSANDDLFSAAIHNAREGCVIETWTALLAHHQAARAHDLELRRAFAGIADDETRHAQLAWDLHEWFLAQLDPAQRRLVAAARARAIAELPRLAQSQAAHAPAGVGMPTLALAGRLAQDFGARLAAA